MIRSMTAFSRHESQHQWGQLTWEIRSVNHRYLEPQIKLPDSCRALEPSIREQLSTQLSRGKVECLLRYQTVASQDSPLVINETLLEQLIRAADKVTQKLNSDQPSQALVMDLLRWPGVLNEAKLDTEQLHQDVLNSFGLALADMSETRAREGCALKILIEERLNGIEKLTKVVREALPDIIQHQRQKLLSRIQELSVEVDDNRIEQELVILAQKMDVDEELDRLNTHVNEVRHILNKGGACGRKLDFLMQELNREANTLSSKSINANTTQAAVELKVLIEQMREQIQNIE